MGVEQTKGHCAGNGGLRGHSVGDVFPCVIYQKGIPGAITWWVKQPNGVDAGPHLTYDGAERSARSFNDGQGDPLIADVRIAKVQLHEEDGETNCVAWHICDEVPFDVYGVYGAERDGCEWHLADYDTYSQARDAMAQCVAALNHAGGVGNTVPYRQLLRMLNP